MSELSHVDEAGAVRMVDVGDKPLSRRRAVARGRGADGAGDGAAAARPAEGRRARDRAARRDHGREADERADPALPSAAALERRGRRSRSREDAVEITAVAETTAQTGVEMEALTAASVAALTVYDMARRSTRTMVDRRRAAAREDEGAGVKAAVLTVSDRVVARRGARTGAATCSRSCCASDGYEVERRVVPDERDADRRGARASSRTRRGSS